MTTDIRTAAQNLAIRFHDTYERLAPSFGYETRLETRAFDPTTPNGRLMIAVCAELLPSLAQPAAAPSRDAVARMLYEADPIYESGENIDGFQVTPGGDLTWEQFLDNCAEFGDDKLFHGWEDRRKAIYDLADAILALFPAPAAEGWRDIASAPRNGTTFIAWLRGESSNAPHIVYSGWMGLARYKPNYPDGPPTIEYEGWRHPVTKAPTHWHPLPEPPAPPFTAEAEQP